MVVEAAPYLRVQPLGPSVRRDALYLAPDHGLQGALLVRGDGSFRRLRGRAFGSTVHPVVPQDVIAFGLVELYLCPQLRPHLPGVDAVEVGGQLADRHADHFLFATVGSGGDNRLTPSGGCCHDDNTPSALIALELSELRRPIQAQIFNDGLHGRKRLSLVVDAEDGVAVEGDGRKLAHDGLLTLGIVEKQKRRHDAPQP